MTSWYFESTLSSRLSMGGSMMPWFVPAMGEPPGSQTDVGGRRSAPEGAQTDSLPREGHDLFGGPPDVVVDDAEVELPLRGQLDLRRAPAPRALLGALRAAADEPL